MTDGELEPRRRRGQVAPLIGFLLSVLMLVGALACGTAPVPPAPTPAPLTTATDWLTPSVLPTWPPTATPEPPDSGWLAVLPGVDYRLLRVAIGEVVERLTVVRVEPQAVRLRVAYDPLAPRVVSAWAQQAERPLLVINGAYFTPENETLGLLIADGQAWGTPYGEYAGMLAVTGDGHASVRWLRDHPYTAGEALSQALQSYPVLVKPGGVMGFPADADDGQPSRRSVVAQDAQGRILFVVAPNGYFSLHSLARFLAESDLQLDVAMNLDGGTSSGLWLQLDPAPLIIESLIAVPSVIIVEGP